MTWLRSLMAVLFGRSLDPAKIVPIDQAQAHLLERADGLLEHPRIQALERRRQDDLRESFARAGRRLGRR